MDSVGVQLEIGLLAADTAGYLSSVLQVDSPEHEMLPHWTWTPSMFETFLWLA